MEEVCKVPHQHAGSLRRDRGHEKVIHACSSFNTVQTAIKKVARKRRTEVTLGIGKQRWRQLHQVHVFSLRMRLEAKGFSG